MKKTNFIIVLVLAVFSSGFFLNTVNSESLPTDASSSCNDTITTSVFNSWFESGTARLNGAVKPANSVTFPDIPNCSFYAWTEQMFLWLTSPSSTRHGGTGLVMNSPAFYDVSPPDEMGNRSFIPHENGKIRLISLRQAQLGAHDLPVFTDKKSGKLMELMEPPKSASGKQLIANAEGEEVEIGNIRMNDNKQPVFLDVSGREILGAKPILLSKKDTLFNIQARRLNSAPDSDRTSIVQRFMNDKAVIFLDLNSNVINVEQGQAETGAVLMSQNDSLVYYSTMVNQVFAYYRTMQGPTIPVGTQFPINQQQLDKITNFAEHHGKTIIDPEALAIEVKASWVEADGLVDRDKFIQMEAIIPTYDKSKPNQWVPNGQKKAMLALVGMHVVGSTKGHPEMLWGTFEHVSNTPNATYSYTKSSGTGTVTQSTAGSWMFSAANSAEPFNQLHMRMRGNDIFAPESSTISASNTLRTMPFGMEGAAASSNAELITINNSVRNKLDNADLRKNYIQIGTTWTISGASPTFGTSSNQVGTNKLSNTTMETYQQGSNCFDCHLTNSKKEVTTGVSHIFDVLKPLF